MPDEAAFPTLDLGELGAAIDAQLRDADLDTEAAAPEPVAAAAPADNSPVGVSPSGEPEPPAADAGDDFEARFQERFKAEYAERSKADIGKLRSSLDRRINDQRVRLEDLQGQLDVANVGFEKVVEDLGRYDPDLARQYTAMRQNVESRTADARRLERYQRREVEARRVELYQEIFGDIVSPDEPDLRAAWDQGNLALEQERMRVHALRRGLVVDEATGRYVLPPGAAPASAPTAPRAPASVPVSPAQATPPRDPDTGKFLSPNSVEARVLATRERESARGQQILTSGATARPKVVTDPDEASAIFSKGLGDLFSKHGVAI